MRALQASPAPLSNDLAEHVAVFADGPGLQVPGLVASKILPTNKQAESLSSPLMDGHSLTPCVGASGLNVTSHGCCQMGQSPLDAASSQPCPGVGVINADVNVEHNANTGEEGVPLNPQIAGAGTIDVSTWYLLMFL